MVAAALAANVAFVHVNVIRMDAERVELDQTVIVAGDRVTAIGPTASIVVPAGALIVDGSGHYLLPGLTDAHVHLNTGMPWAPTRADFGDGPMYLAYGITSVLNLSGAPETLDWRRRVASGDIIGPTIYTSGPFVNEPRVSTVDEVRREIAAQARDGYDAIKFHELDDTTSGLSLPAYVAMNQAARDAQLPLVGHAPIFLGLEALLDAGQPLAHVGMLTNIYFLPLLSHVWVLPATLGALIVLLPMTLPWTAAVLVRRVRLASVAGVVTAVLLAQLLPGGPLYASTALRVVTTAGAAVIVACAVSLIVVMIQSWRRPASTSVRMQATVAATACLTLAITTGLFWIPVAWRSTETGLDRIAERVQGARIPVITTLVVYETMRDGARGRLLHDEAVDFLRPETRVAWRALSEGGRPGYRYDEFAKRLTRALHRADVTLIAGTDAMGVALVAPGSSLHRELELLRESGLSPYEAIRAATVAPATFLRKQQEFGTVAIGKRADLILVERNPLEDLSTLRRPIGVMTRGVWFTRDRLRRLLAALTSTRRPS